MPPELAYALMVWCAAHYLTSERGPFALLLRLRQLVGVQVTAYGDEQATTELAYLVSCMACTSLWLAVLPTLYLGQPPYWILWYSGVSILLGRWMERD